MRWDLVVVGAGLAGLTAAVRVAEAGRRVLVLAKGVGGTHLGAGTIDILGYACPRSGSESRAARVDRPREALAGLVTGQPDHPYAVLGAAPLSAAIEWFKGRFAEGPLRPYTYLGGLDENLLLPTAVGVPKPTAVVPETMAAGDLRAGGRFCIVGFRRLKDFHAPLLADNLARTELASGIAARGIELDLPASGPADLNAIGLARHFDEAGFRAELVAQLVGRLGGEERVGFPAVLGIADPHGAWGDLERRLERPVFEIPTLPPSVPGIRAFTTLRDGLRRAGGRLIFNAVVVGGERADRRLTAVRAIAGGRESLYEAARVVVATGGFASGGLELDSRWRARETALGLPVVGVPGPGGERFGPEYFGDHPMARAGVAVDGELRPVDERGDPLYENVHVAGASLAGSVPWREQSGNGVSLASGYRAAEVVLESAGAPPSAAARSAVEA
jgi:glycerol-3-phosphate dehydrogenase subunit B